MNGIYLYPIQQRGRKALLTVWEMAYEESLTCRIYNTG